MACERKKSSGAVDKPGAFSENTASFLEGFPSGQRDQTVNLTAPPSVVRIHPPPPKFELLLPRFAGVGSSHRSFRLAGRSARKRRNAAEGSSPEGVVIHPPSTSKLKPAPLFVGVDENHRRGSTEARKRRRTPRWRGDPEGGTPKAWSNPPPSTKIQDVCTPVSWGGFEPPKFQIGGSIGAEAPKRCRRQQPGGRGHPPTPPEQ